MQSTLHDAPITAILVHLPEFGGGEGRVALDFDLAGGAQDDGDEVLPALKPFEDAHAASASFCPNANAKNAFRMLSNASPEVSPG